MSKKTKLLEKAERNPGGLSIKEFRLLMTQSGWSLDHQKGSHEIWYSPDGARVSVQNCKGKAKSYQGKQFLFKLAEENNDER